MKSSFPAFAAIVLATSPAAAHEKDLRTQTDAQGETEVAFCSRPSPDTFGVPGHTFVMFSDVVNGQRSIRAVGQSIPAGAAVAPVVFSYFTGASVAGQQMEERYTSIRQNCLVVKVNRSSFNAAVAAAQPTLTSIGLNPQLAAAVERYTLGTNDCITFAEKVANSLKTSGLVVPPRTALDTPAGWIKKLVTANS
jgi:hypothetical protein